DHPTLPSVAGAGLDCRLRTRSPVADIEALSTMWIDQFKELINPDLCASPVAIGKLDERPRCRPAPCNFETFSARSGRSEAKYIKTGQIPHLGKGRVAGRGLHRRVVDCESPSHVQAH